MRLIGQQNRVLMAQKGVRLVGQKGVRLFAIGHYVDWWGDFAFNWEDLNTGYQGETNTLTIPKDVTIYIIFEMHVMTGAIMFYKNGSYHTSVSHGDTVSYDEGDTIQIRADAEDREIEGEILLVENDADGKLIDSGNISLS